MHIVIRKFYYGDIPDSPNAASAVDSASTGENQKRYGLYGKFLSGANKAWIINMQAAFMPLMHKWPLKMPVMFIHGVTKASAFGWLKANISMHQTRMMQKAFYEPANDKVYRYPTFFDLPDELKHM
jgi:ring-1,2-phenylacetyl-CoA epoxidase subunit PaaB